MEDGAYWEDARYWEMFAEPDGSLNVERHGGRWEFVPNAPLGRPPKKPRATKPQPQSPLDLLPPHIAVTRLAVV